MLGILSPEIIFYDVPVKKSSIHFMEALPKFQNPYMSKNYKNCYIFINGASPSLYYIKEDGREELLAINEVSIDRIIQTVITTNYKRLYALNWLHGISNISLHEQIEDMEEMSKKTQKNQGIDMKISSKYQNTKNFMNHAESISEKYETKTGIAQP